MTSIAPSSAAAAFGLGVALAGAPGSVQAVLVAEAVRGGIGRGFRALAGAQLTFGLLLACLALGLSVALPTGLVLRVLKVAGGVLLLWLAVEGLRSARAPDRAPGRAPTERRALPPAARGSLAVLLNPGAWLFLGAVASPLLATGARLGGTGRALLLAAALVAGTVIGDSVVVLALGVGLRRAGHRAQWWIRRALATVLAGLGVWLLIGGLVW